MRATSVTRNAEEGKVTFRGRLDGINELLQQRSLKSRQGPRQAPADEYCVDVRYVVQGSADSEEVEIHITKVNIRVPEYSTRAYLLYDYFRFKQGEVTVNSTGSLKLYFLPEGGKAIADLKALVLEIEERHKLHQLNRQALKRLVKQGPAAIPEDEDEGDAERDKRERNLAKSLSYIGHHTP